MNKIKKCISYLIIIFIAVGYAAFFYNICFLSKNYSRDYLDMATDCYYWVIFLIVAGFLIIGYIFLKWGLRVKKSVIRWFGLYLSSIYLFLLLSKNYFDIDDLIKRSSRFIFLIVFFIMLLIINEGLLRKILHREINRDISPYLLFAIIIFIYIILSTDILFSTVPLVGDEPHYLLVTHSILYDKDLNVRNNYLNKDYLSYVNGKLGIQAVFGRRGDSEFYSIHMPMVSIYMIPYYWLAQHLGRDYISFFVKLGMSLIGAIGVVFFYILLREEFGKENSIKVWLVQSLLPPMFFYSRQFYPETSILLISIVIYWRYLRGDRVVPLFLAGVLPLFGSKYLAISIGFLLVFLRRDIVGYIRDAEKKGLLKYIAWLSPVIIYLVYLEYIYGYIVPTAQYQGKEGESKVLLLIKHYLIGLDWRDRIGSFFSYFLDQRDGLIPYAPIYFCAFLGVIIAYKRARERFLDLLTISLPYLFVYSFLTHRGGFCPAARPLVAIIWVFGYFLAYFYEYNRSLVYRKVASILVLVSIFTLIYLIENPLAVYQATTHSITERSSDLTRAISNIYVDLWLFYPSFLKLKGGYWIANYIWVIIIILILIHYSKAWKGGGIDEVRGSILGCFIMYLVAVIYFCGVPQFTLRNWICEEKAVGYVKICANDRKIVVEDGGSSYYSEAKTLILLIESSSALKQAEIVFDKTKNLPVRISYFDRLVSSYSEAKDKVSIRLFKSYEAKGKIYYLMKFESLCKKRKCPFGFHLFLR